MGEIVNLRRVKKARQRQTDAAGARENRIRHGRTLAQKANEETARRREARAADAARLDPQQD